MLLAFLAVGTLFCGNSGCSLHCGYCLCIYFWICGILFSKFCATLKISLGVLRGPEVFVQVITLRASVPLAMPLLAALQFVPLSSDLESQMIFLNRASPHLFPAESPPGTPHCLAVICQGGCRLHPRYPGPLSHLQSRTPVRTDLFSCHLAMFSGLRIGITVRTLTPLPVVLRLLPSGQPWHVLSFATQLTLPDDLSKPCLP